MYHICINTVSANSQTIRFIVRGRQSFACRFCTLLEAVPRHPHGSVCPRGGGARLIPVRHVLAFTRSHEGNGSFSSPNLSFAKLKSDTSVVQDRELAQLRTYSAGAPARNCALKGSRPPLPSGIYAYAILKSMSSFLLSFIIFIILPA